MIGERDVRLDDARGNRASMARSSPGNRSDCGSMRGRRWYAVAAKYRQEEAAALAVQALGFPFFLPMVPNLLPKGGVELRPLCAPYLFVEFDAANDPWHAINRQQPVRDRGVLYLSDPCRPTPVPDRMLDALRTAIAKRGSELNAVRDPVAELVAIGASVRLIGGVAAGKAGTVTDSRRRGGLVEARVECEGCVLPLWVPADRLMLLQATP
jgi:transcription antitermination factor NusG